MDGLGGVDKSVFLEQIMESLLASVLVLIASVATIAGLAIAAIILLVLGQALILLYRALARPHGVAFTQARESGHQC